MKFRPRDSDVPEANNIEPPARPKMEISLIFESESGYSVGLYIDGELLLRSNAFKNQDEASTLANVCRVKLGLFVMYEAVVRGPGGEINIALRASDIKEALAKLIEKMGEHALADGFHIRKMSDLG